MIAIAVEPFSRIRDEIQPLWQRHYDEIAEDKARIPLDPDMAKYSRLEAGGHLHVVTARRADKLVGYAFCVVDTHIHYRSTLVAMYDLYYLVPEARGGRTAVKLFHAMERHLKSIGVVKAFANTKLAHDQGRLWEAMGWREAERLYVKTLGG